MPEIENSVLNDMLKNISDPKLRETYGAILSGKFPYKVYCLAKTRVSPDTGKDIAGCDGRCIGYIDKKGRVISEDLSDKKGRPISGIFTSRDRFDGLKGFKCHCGNDSIVADEEKDIIVPMHTPNQKDLLTIHERITSRKRPGPAWVNNVIEYGGFRIVKAEGAV